MRNVHDMTEKELRDTEERYEKLLREGHATLVQANKLTEIRHALKRIEQVKQGLGT